MAKYSRVYREAGTESVVEILPSIASMLLAHQGWRGGGSRSVRQVCDLIEHRASDAEIIVHLFSNNGFVFFGSCLLAQPGLSKLVSAVILDSAPCYITSDVAATGLISATQRVEAAEAGKQRLRRVIKAGVWPLVRVLDRRQAAVWRAWQQHCPEAPHLFLYSAADGVVPPTEIEAFAEKHCARLRMLGVASHLSRWDTAPHCGDDMCCVCVGAAVMLLSLLLMAKTDTPTPTFAHAHKHCVCVCVCVYACMHESISIHLSNHIHTRAHRSTYPPTHMHAHTHTSRALASRC